MPINVTGLSSDEVIQQRQKYGSNVIQAEDDGNIWHIIKEIVSEPLFLILILTAILYIILGEYNEALIMFLALLFVSGISVYQENRSRNAVNALKKMADDKVKVLRNGGETLVDSSDLVVGDIVFISDGQMVPADAIILDCNDFSVNESMLTGESLPVFKKPDSDNELVSKGTMVVSGACVARAIAVGSHTSMGKIGTSLANIKEEKTPLQIQISNFTHRMVFAGIVAFIFVWAMNYLLNRDIIQSLLRGLTLAMSVLPEEIPVAFSTFMALGAYHLYKKGVIARSPYTVEVLGAATVICTDKTGTLTENKMQLAGIYDFQKDEVYNYTESAYANNEVLTYAMWASECDPFDAMEKSIHEAYGNTTNDDQRKHFKMCKEYPLQGHLPIMTHIFKGPGNELIAAVKGSVEGILKQTHLSEADKLKISEQVNAFATLGYRVLGVGKSSVIDNQFPEFQGDFVYQLLGLIAFYDPPKENIQQVIAQFYQSGIQVKMVTGDYAQTALSIAHQVGLKHRDKVMTGEQVMTTDPKTLQKMAKEINVFARMYPEAKLKLIEALKSNHEIVAMTGDGVNDGPALKAAHIGIAMGKGGSEVARKAASLVLLDDDLSWMVDAIALGRRIYENLKKAIMYIISIHIPIILIVALPLLFFWKYANIFSPIHVIFLELIMGPTCSIIFENEPIEANSMQKPPRQLGIDLFSYRELTVSIMQGLIITATCLGLGYYFMFIGSSESLVRTVIYTTLIFCNIFLTLVNRSFYYSLLSTIRYNNYLIPLIIFISVVILLASIYIQAIQSLFKFEKIPVSTIGLCMVFAFFGVIWVEIVKWYRRASLKNSQTT